MNRLILLGALFTLGCGADDLSPPIVSLDAPVTVSAKGPAFRSYVRFDVEGGSAPASSEITIPIDRLSAAFHTDRQRGVIDRLELPLGDVEVPPDAMPPVGLPLRDLALGMQPPVRATIAWAERDALELIAEVPLVLTWEMQLPDGTHYPLGPVYTNIVKVSFHVFRDARGLTTTVSTRCPGVCWDIPGVVTVRDLIVWAETDAVTASPR